MISKGYILIRSLNIITLRPLNETITILLKSENMLEKLDFKPWSKTCNGQ